jgi:hypothetical protein
MDLYLNRFLNAPSARQPTAASTADLGDDAEALMDRLVALTDERQRVEEAAAVTFRYRSAGHPDGPLLATLGRILLREDANFHTYQMLEAGFALHSDLQDRRPDLATGALVAVARYLAGHAPTDRATTQTYRIAVRLHAGEALAAD